MAKPVSNLWADQPDIAQAVILWEFVVVGDVLDVAATGVRAAYMDVVDVGVVDVLLGTSAGSVRLASFATSAIEPISLGGA